MLPERGRKSRRGLLLAPACAFTAAACGSCSRLIFVFDVGPEATPSLGGASCLTVSRREPLPKRVTVQACTTLGVWTSASQVVLPACWVAWLVPVVSGVSSTGLCQCVLAHHTVLMQLSSRGITAANVRVYVCEGCDTCCVLVREAKQACTVVVSGVQRTWCAVSALVSRNAPRPPVLLWSAG